MKKARNKELIPLQPPFPQLHLPPRHPSGNPPASIQPQYMAPPVLSPSPPPINYILVPQEVFRFRFSHPTSIPLPPIEFTPVLQVGVNPPYKLTAKNVIENPCDRIPVPSREMIVRILWPGYPRHPFEIKIGTREGNVTRREIFDLVCRGMFEFEMMLRAKDARIVKGDKQWAIKKKGKLKVERFFIARLLDRGGNYFQPEIWVPRPVC